MARAKLPNRQKPTRRTRTLVSRGGTASPPGSPKGLLKPINQGHLSPAGRSIGGGSAGGIGLGATSPTEGEGVVSSGRDSPGAEGGGRSRAASPPLSPGGTFAITDMGYGGEDLEEGGAEGVWPDENKPRAVSAIGARRISSARAVGLDATFYRYTKRPSTSSALGISLRHPAAPVDGTEEETSILRQITDQGKEYDMIRKSRGYNLRKSMGFETSRPPITPMGDYNTDEKVVANNERERLFQRLQTKPKSDREAMEELIKKQAAESGDNQHEAKIAEKVPMINGGRRRRFVGDVAVPPERVEGAVEKIMKANKKAQDEEAAKKMGLSGEKMEAERRKMEEAILSGGTGEADADDDQSLMSHADVNKKKKDALKRRMIMRAVKKEVKYGKNRVTSTHNSYGHIETPWSTVGGRYAVLPGDRTA